jgi:HAD superfamily hydrolase (TIGR01458 family)
LRICKSRRTSLIKDALCLYKGTPFAGHPPINDIKHKPIEERRAMRAFLIDLDGVLYVGNSPVPGAKECLKFLEDRGYSYRFVSNSTRRCKAAVAKRLKGLGYDISEEHIFTPPLAAIRHMKSPGRNRCYLLTTGDVHRDFQEAGASIVQEAGASADEKADYVIVGDAGENFTFQNLNQAMRILLEGAELLALEKDRYWREPEGLVLSAGPFVAALEYATAKEAQLMGKPSAEFFRLALEDMDASPRETAMIGDDIRTDIAGAQKMGMSGILVRTGKYREDTAKSSEVRPELVLDSIARLPEHLKA